MARFHTRCGLLSAAKSGDWIDLNFPATSAEPAQPPAGLLEALSPGNPLAPHFVGRSKFDYLVEAASEKLLRGLDPDHSRLRKLPVRGIIVTARSDSPEFDFVSRFFAPGSGVDEDPVTGSSHCALGPHWARQLGKNSLMAYQASARGGVVRVSVEGDRVTLGGQAVTVLRGELAA